MTGIYMLLSSNEGRVFLAASALLGAGMGLAAYYIINGQK